MLVNGWSVNIRDWVFVYWMGFSFRGWDVCIRDGVIVYGLDVSKRDAVLVS